MSTYRGSLATTLSAKTTTLDKRDSLVITVPTSDADWYKARLLAYHGADLKYQTESLYDYMKTTFLVAGSAKIVNEFRADVSAYRAEKVEKEEAHKQEVLTVKRDYLKWGIAPQAERRMVDLDLGYEVTKMTWIRTYYLVTGARYRIEELDSLYQ